MALISVPMFPRDGSITIEDATATPISMTVQYEDGDFQFGPITQGQWSKMIVRDRGVMYGARNTEEQEVSFSFSAHATDFTDATEKTLMDVFRKAGPWSSGVSTLGASADVWAVTVAFTAEQTDYGAGADSSVTLTYCWADVSFAEGEPGKFSISGTAMLLASAGITIA